MKSWHWLILAFLTVVSLVAQLAGEAGHGPWVHVSFFWAVFGFVGCALIIIISKAIGKYLVQRREDYYDDL